MSDWDATVARLGELAAEAAKRGPWRGIAWDEFYLESGGVAGIVSAGAASDAEVAFIDAATKPDVIARLVEERNALREALQEARDTAWRVEWSDSEAADKALDLVIAAADRALAAGDTAREPLSE